MANNNNPNPIDRLAVIDDEKKLVLDWYTSEIEIPSVGIFDEPTRCYQINLQWAKIVMGLVSWLTELAAWRNAQDESYPPIIEISKFLVGGNCEMPFMLRQNPLNSCLIEQSSDNGQTWATAFDLSLCMSIVDGTSQTSITQNFVVNNYDTFKQYVYNNYVSNYTNNVTDLVGDLGYEGNTDDNFRNDALCYALTRFIDSVADAALKYFDEVDETANDLKSTLALTAAIVGIVAIAATGIGAIALAGAATLWATGIGLGSALGSELVERWSEQNRSAYEDLQAREDLVCCLYNNLKDANFNQDVFMAIDVDGCNLSTNANAIFQAARIFARQDATYAAMVENMRIGVNSARLGILPSCPCTDNYSVLIYNYPLDRYYWEVVVGEPYQSGQPMNGIDPDPTFGNWDDRDYIHLRKKFTGAKVHVLGIGIDFDATLNCGTTAVNLLVYNEGVFSGNFQLSPTPNGINQIRTFGLPTAGQYFVGDEINLIIDTKYCGAALAETLIREARIWLHTSSPLKGRNETNAPYGTGANGTTNPIWWQ